MKEKERMLAGQLYLSSDTQLTRDRRRTQKILRRFNKLIPSQTAKREKIIRKLLRNVGIACSVYPPFYCDYGYNIEIGDYFFANRNCTILDVGTVAIGNHVMLGPGVMIVTAHHPIDSTLRNKGYGLGTEIRIDDNVWIPSFPQRKNASHHETHSKRERPATSPEAAGLSVVASFTHSF